MSKRKLEGFSAESGKYPRTWPEMQVHNLQELMPAPGTNLNTDRDIVGKAIGSKGSFFKQ